MIIQNPLIISTIGRGLINITDKIALLVRNAKIETGLCHLFLHHTSASLILCENADPAVPRDLEAFMQKHAPDSDTAYEHQAEGADDMPSHIRAILTENSLTIPITQYKLALGTWQGIFFWEHRLDPHERQLTVTILS